MPASKQVSVRLPAALWVELGVSCIRRGVTLQAAVEEAVRRYLNALEGLVEKPAARTKRVAPPVESVSPPVVTEPAPVVTALAPPIQVCKRCGHLKEAHWVKGCLAGCACSEARYRPAP